MDTPGTDPFGGNRPLQPLPDPRDPLQPQTETPSPPPGDLTVVSIKEVQSGLPPPEAIPAEPEPESPAAGITIRTLAALSDATQETVEDLLGYSATEMEQLFDIFNVDVLGKKRIQREIEGLRAVIEAEPEPEPEPEQEPEPSRVLVMGGCDGSSYLNTAELYDPQRQSWSAVPPMGSKRWGPAAVVLPGPRVLVMGGSDGSWGGELNTAELYDPQSQSWSAVAPMGSKRSGPAAVCY